jgi:putative endonuclease
VTPNESNHIEVGQRGEAEALAYLLSRGYRLRDRNPRFGRGELDLVMTAPPEEGGDLVFVEVKASRGAGHGSAGDPAGWVHGRKQLQVQRVAQGYCLQRGLEGLPMRFDVVAVEFGEGGDLRVRHVPNAFLPDARRYWRG